MNGQYAVPKEILELKPSEISCTVKVIRVPTKTTGYKLHFYVYELITAQLKLLKL
jgi:hypothetical protein